MGHIELRFAANYYSLPITSMSAVPVLIDSGYRKQPPERLWFVSVTTVTSVVRVFILCRIVGLRATPTAILAAAARRHPCAEWTFSSVSSFTVVAMWSFGR